MTHTPLAVAPPGITDAAARAAALTVVDQQLDQPRHVIRDVLESLGLAPYSDQRPPNTAYDGGQTYARNRYTRHQGTDRARPRRTP